MNAPRPPRARLGDSYTRHRLVTLPLAHGLLLEQRQDAVALATRLLELSARHVGFRARLRRGGTERIGVDAEQHVALAYGAALLVAALEQDAAHAGTHLDLPRARCAPGVFELERQRAVRHLGDGDLLRRWRHLRGRVVAAGTERDQYREQRQQWRASRRGKAFPCGGLSIPGSRRAIEGLVDEPQQLATICSRARA